MYIILLPFRSNLFSLHSNEVRSGTTCTPPCWAAQSQTLECEKVMLDPLCCQTFFAEHADMGLAFVQDLWICLICGQVGCGRYRTKHAVDHWQESGHCYSLELETQRVSFRPPVQEAAVSCKSDPASASCCNAATVCTVKTIALHMHARLLMLCLQR